MKENPGLESLFGLFGGESHRRAVERVKRDYVKGSKRARHTGQATSAGGRDPEDRPRRSSPAKHRRSSSTARRMGGFEAMERLYGPAPKKRGRSSSSWLAEMFK